MVFEPLVSVGVFPHPALRVTTLVLAEVLPPVAAPPAVLVPAAAVVAAVLEPPAPALEPPVAGTPPVAMAPPVATAPPAAAHAPPVASAPPDPFTVPPEPELEPPVCRAPPVPSAPPVARWPPVAELPPISASPPWVPPVAALCEVLPPVEGEGAVELDARALDAPPVSEGLVLAGPVPGEDVEQATHAIGMHRTIVVKEELFMGDTLGAATERDGKWPFYGEAAHGHEPLEISVQK